MRPSGRAPQDLRNISFTRNFTKHAEGSVLTQFGDTHVLCTASINEHVPRFLKGTQQGWLTAEYSMLPRATKVRTDREAARGKQVGRTVEIQRLIGRSLRGAIDLKALGERTIVLDCDVLQADGGTRTAAISGAMVALMDAAQVLIKRNEKFKNLLTHQIAAISVGILDGVPVLDLDYKEDSKAETDMNVVMNETGGFMEIQGTAEGKAFAPAELQAMLELAQNGCETILAAQKAVFEA